MHDETSGVYLYLGNSITAWFDDSLIRFVSLKGFLDKVGNQFAPENKERVEQYRFHLEYSSNGQLEAVDEVRQKKMPVNYRDGVFSLSALEPYAKN